MARERRDTAARQSDQRGAATSADAGAAAASAPLLPLSSELADQHRQQVLALVRALARDAAREDHEHDIAGR